MFSVILLTHNSEKVIIKTLDSIKNQSYNKFELIISDDFSNDKTNEIILNFINTNKNIEIKYLKSNEKIGYPANLKKAFEKTSRDYIFLASHDDILANNVLEIYKNYFNKYKNIAAITRPYFWFSKNLSQIIRIKKPIDLNNEKIINIYEKNKYNLAITVSSFDQLSTLCIKRHFVEKYGFSDDVFTAHARPFLKVLIESNILFINEFLVAVRFEASMSRSLKSIYQNSPLKEWVKQINELNNTDIKNYLLKKYFFQNFVGLVQIKVFGSFFLFIRESFLLIKFKPSNLLNIGFWFFFLICLIFPPKFVRFLSDFYKFKINSKMAYKYNKYISFENF